MTTWITFRKETGAAHPDAETLKVSPLALLLLTLLRNNEDVFGAHHPITVNINDLSGEAVTQLSPDDEETLVQLTPLRFPAVWFRENPLPEEARKFIQGKFAVFTAEQRKKNR